MSGAESGVARAAQANRRRILVIHNPRAGDRGARRLAAVLDRLRAGGAEIEHRRTAARGDAEAFARTARQLALLGGPAPDVVVVAGGDGTINEVINGMAGGALPLAVVPLGTANVLAAEIGWPSGEAAVAAAILAGPARPVHLGVVNGRRFLLMAGVGMDAEVVAAVDTRVKRVLGKGAYVLAMLWRWLVRRRCHYTVIVDGVHHRAASAVVAKAHYYGGRFVCAPDARLDVAALHDCLFENPSRLAALRYMVALALGRLSRQADVRVIPAQRISIEPEAAWDHPDPVQADGDIVARLPVRVELAPETLQLVHPLSRGG